MTYQLKMTFALLILFFSQGFAADYTVKDTTVIARKLPTATVVIAPAKTRTKPSFQSPALYTLKLGDKVSIFSQTKDWFAIRLQTKQGSILASWIEKTAVQIDSPKSPPVVVRPVPALGFIPPKPLPMPTPIFTPAPFVESPRQNITATQRREKKEENAHQIGLLAAPTYDVYQFGANQKRVGLFYTHRLNSTVALDVPASYSFGDGFNSIQAGAGLMIDVWQKGAWLIFSRIDILGERFYDSTKHFYAATLDAGFGVQWMFVPNFGVSLEPFSAEVMGYNTESIPLNVRAQGIMRLIYSW